MLMASVTLPRSNVAVQTRRVLANLMGRSASVRAARRARYRLLARGYRLRIGDGIAPQTNELFTLMAQAHDASRALTRSTRREARRRSLGERIRDRIRGINYYFVGLGLVGLAGMVLTAALHLGPVIGLVFTLIWLAGTLPYVFLEGVALLLRLGLDLTEMWNPARKWGWTTFDGSVDDADRKFVRRLALFHRDDIEYIEALVRRRLERARGRIIGMRVVVVAIGSVFTYFGVRDYLAKYVAGLLPHLPTLSVLMPYLALVVFLLMFGGYVFGNPSSVLAMQRRLVKVAVKRAKRSDATQEAE